MCEARYSFTGSSTNVEVRVGVERLCEGTTHLLEANGIGLLAEALTAEVKTVLADETSLVGTVTAGRVVRVSTVAPSLQEEGVFTIHGSPFRTCGDERTKRRRGSF